jgi:hypothetical protein
MINAYKVLSRKPERKRPLHRKIILKWILRKLGGRVWTGFNSPSGGLF